MPLIPFDRFDVESPLPAEELSSRLAGSVEPKRWLRSGRGERPFEGTVEDEGRFRIQRVIGYRNSFLPTLAGTVERTPGGSRIRGTMTMSPLVGIFIVIWLLGVLFFASPFLIAPREAAASPDPLWVAPVGMFLFGWLLVSGAFTFESRQAHRLLRQIASAEVARETARGETPAKG